MQDRIYSAAVMDWFLTTLGNDPQFKQVEPYEGQFEDASDFVILPPSIFIALDRCVNNAEREMDLDYSVSLYVCTAHVHGTDPGGILDLLDYLINSLHAQPVRIFNPDTYFGRCFYSGYEWLGIFPGFACYKISFTIKG